MFCTLVLTCSTGFSSLYLNVNFWEFLFRTIFCSEMYDTISLYFRLINSSNSCKSLFKTAFMVSKFSKILHATVLCCFGFPEEMHCEQIGMSHCLQCSSHTFDECFWHVEADPKRVDSPENLYIFIYLKCRKFLIVWTRRN